MRGQHKAFEHQGSQDKPGIIHKHSIINGDSSGGTMLKQGHGSRSKSNKWVALEHVPQGALQHALPA